MLVVLRRRRRRPKQQRKNHLAINFVAKNWVSLCSLAHFWEIRVHSDCWCIFQPKHFDNFFGGIISNLCLSLKSFFTIDKATMQIAKINRFAVASSPIWLTTHSSYLDFLGSGAIQCLLSLAEYRTKKNSTNVKRRKKHAVATVCNLKQ